MKRPLLGALTLIACSALVSCSNSTTTTTETKSSLAKEPETKQEQVARAVGFYFHEQIERFPVELDIEQVLQGVRDANAGLEPPMEQQEFMKEMLAIRQKAVEAQGDQNLKLAEAYLEDNQSKVGVQSAEEGKLQWVVIKEGAGPSVTAESAPMIHYEGRYIDGTVFDSSMQRGAPVTLKLATTIPGFRKGVVGMKEGEKRRLYVHPELGYGSKGPLAPNSLLIFEVEVIEVTPDAEQDIGQGPVEEPELG